jgi:hypothetical protein
MTKRKYKTPLSEEISALNLQYKLTPDGNQKEAIRVKLAALEHQRTDERARAQEARDFLSERNITNHIELIHALNEAETKLKAMTAAHNERKASVDALSAENGRLKRKVERMRNS